MRGGEMDALGVARREKSATLAMGGGGAGGNGRDQARREMMKRGDAMTESER
jgi:hypothetical protein